MNEYLFMRPVYPHRTSRFMMASKPPTAKRPTLARRVSQTSQEKEPQKKAINTIAPLIYYSAYTFFFGKLLLALLERATGAGP